MRVEKTSGSCLKLLMSTQKAGRMAMKAAMIRTAWLP
jgi:hypothetical protein